MKVLIVAVLVALAACSVRSERTVQTPPPAAATTTVTTPPAAPATTTTVYTR